jgi:hypothetical protein
VVLLPAILHIKTTSHDLDSDLNINHTPSADVQQSLLLGPTCFTKNVIVNIKQQIKNDISTRNKTLG